MMRIGVGARMIRKIRLLKYFDIIKRDVNNKLQKLFKKTNYYNAYIYRDCYKISKLIYLKSLIHN